MDNLPSKAYETPIPSADIRAATNKLVESLGGTCYPKSVHSDRLSPPPEGSAEPLELAACDHRGVVVDLPDPGGKRGDVRLCDALPRVPRIQQRAKEIVG